MDENERIAAILGEWYDQHERGDGASPEELIRAHPDLAEKLRARLAAVEFVDLALSEPRELPEGVPKQIGGYRIVREIGRGGMGVVYEAEQVSMERRVALKVLSLAFTGTAQSVQRFQREAKAAGRLHHTNIVPVHTMDQHAGLWYYAMDLVDGPPLVRVIAHLRAQSARPSEESLAKLSVTGPAPAEEESQPTRDLIGTGTGERAYFLRLADMFAGVAEALHLAHGEGIIHRDIKPSNLLLDADGTLKIVDFGLARLEGDGPSMTITGDLLGTPTYMSPEQAMAKRIEIDHRTDVYSLGATLYEVLTLRPPFRGKTLQEICSQIITKDPVLPRRTNHSIPRDLETVVLKAMEKDRDKRYQSAGEFARDLRRFAVGGAIHARRIGLAGRTWRRIKRHKVRSALAAAAILLALAGSLFAIRAGREAARLRDAEYARLCAAGQAAVAHSVFDADRCRAADSASEFFSSAIALEPDRPEAYWLRAFAPARGLRERLDDLDAAHARGGVSDRSYHLGRAAVLAEFGRASDAEKERVLAAGCGPATSRDRFHDACLLDREGRRTEALNELNEVLDTPDLSADVRYGAVLRRGHLHLKSRSWAAALEDFLEAQSLGDDSRHVRLHLVALWRVLGQDRRADALLEQILSGRSDADQASTLATHAIRLSWDLKWHEHALGVCERALEIEEETARAWTSRGEVLLQLDRLEEAVKSFERALQLEPTILDAKMKLGSALIRLERPHEALRIYDDVLAERPRLAFALNARGYLLSTFLQRNEEALKAHDEAIRLDPMDARYHGCRGSVLWRLNRHEEALAAFDEAIRLEPRLPFEHWTWLRKQRAGLLCDVFGRFEDALVDIDAALRSAPADPWCLPARALTLSNLHRWNEAIEAADRSLALQPNQIPIHRVRWRALNALGRYAEALECCDGAARLFRARPHWHYTARAAILNNLGRYDEALQEVESAIELAPNSASGHHVRAYAFDKLGRHEEAIAGFRRALALDASRRGSATNLAWILVTAPAGDLRAPREALELVRRARSAKPTSFSGLVLGVAHYRLGEMDAAAESIEEALRGFDETEEIIFESTRVKAMLFLAMTHARLGDANAAQSWFTAAIDRMERHNVEEPDLGRFRAEAEEVLGIEPK